jgi:hypothetical protein
VPKQVPSPSECTPIERHLLGRRGEGRVQLKHLVECQGVQGRHPGQLLDLSRKGALLTMFDDRFQAPRDVDLVVVAERLNAEFGKRITVRFVKAAVVLNASLVRVARAPMRGHTVVACAFDRDLTVRERRLLGLDLSEKNQLP